MSMTELRLYFCTEHLARMVMERMGHELLFPCLSEELVEKDRILYKFQNLVMLDYKSYGDLDSSE